MFYSVQALTPVQAEDGPIIVSSDLADLETTAADYLSTGLYAEAEQTYQTIIAEYPGTDNALFAQKDLAFLYITQGEDLQAVDAFEVMTADFADNPNLPYAIYQIANKYQGLQRHAEARDVYQYVAQNNPESEFGIRGQTWTAGSEIQLGNFAAADEAIETLKTNFSQSPLLFESIDALGYEYWRAGKPDKSKELYQYLLQNSSDNDLLIKGQVYMASCEVRLGNYTAADEAIGQFLLEYPDQEQIAWVVYDLAYKYGSVQNYAKTREHYQSILSKWPNHERALDVQASLIAMDIRENVFAVEPNEVDAESLADFVEDAQMPLTIFRVAEYAYDKKALLQEKEGNFEKADENLQRAIALWDELIIQYPDHELAAISYHMAGDCYHRLGQLDETQQYYQEILNNHPDYRYAWHVQFMIGRIYQEMEEADLISKTDADLLTQNAYEQMLELYPDCPAAKAANNWLRIYYKNYGEQG